MGDTAKFADLGSKLSHKIIAACIEVHKFWGPGLLESVYEECLSFQFRSEGVNFLRQHELPIFYKGTLTDLSYRVDFIVENSIIIELKSVEKLLPVHHAQILTYMKLSGVPLGLLINFNSILLKDGIKRMALSKADL